MPEIAIPTALTINAPTASALAAPVDDLEFRSSMIVINSTESLEEATAIMNDCTKRYKALDAERKKLTDPLKKTAAAIKELFDRPINRYKAVVDEMKKGIATYHIKQERIAEEARKKAEAEAEKIRLEAEKEIEKAPEQAEAITMAVVAQTATVQALATQTAPTKVKGATITKVWKCEVTDLAQFLTHVATHTELQSAIEIKMGVLDRLVSTTSGELKIPGIRTYQETRVASR